MIGKKIIRLTETISTNSFASDLLKSEKPAEGTVIIADSQIEGKGQHGNRWESEIGKNLTFSIILYPDFLKPEKQFLLNKFVSLSVLDFVSSLLEDKASVKIKWPNDIYVGDKKIAGILIENSICGNQLENVIVGIGININQVRFSKKIPNPVSLKMITGNTYGLEICLKKICVIIQKRYAQLLVNSGISLDPDYLKKNYRYHIFSDFKIKNGIIFAKICGVTDIGKLQIEDTEGKISEYAFKEIEYII